VIVILSWLIAVIFTWRHLGEDLWRFEQHISVYLTEHSPHEGTWPVYAATPRFLSLDSEGRLDAANTFYERNIGFWDTIYFTPRLKEWIIKSSQYDLKKAPALTQQWNNYDVTFRNFPIEGVMVAPKLTYVLFNSNTLAIAAFLAIFLGFILSIFLWVMRGFQKP